MIGAIFVNQRVIVAGKKGQKLYDKSYFGSLISEGLQLSLVEALYLVENKKIKVKFEDGKTLSFEKLMEESRKIEKDIFLRYTVFKDLREKGYVVKTGLKYGSYFRVYSKEGGMKEHSPYLVHVYPETEKLKIQEFTAKARVAHSVRKDLVIAIVDEEGDVTYYLCKWFKL